MQRLMTEFIRELISESEKIHITEQTDRPQKSTIESTKFNSLPGDNQHQPGVIGKFE